MVSSCENVTAGSSGEDICDMLEGTGVGLSTFLEQIRGPLGKFIATLALIGAIVGIVVAVAVVVKNAASSGTGRGRR